MIKILKGYINTFKWIDFSGKMRIILFNSLSIIYSLLVFLLVYSLYISKVIEIPVYLCVIFSLLIGYSILIIFDFTLYLINNINKEEKDGKYKIK